jgi:hypothetical protein
VCRRFAYRARIAAGNVVRMPGRPNHAYQWRLASGSQLWRLNQLGRLQVVDDAVSISSAEANAVIKAELEKLGADRFPDTRRARGGEAVVS